MLLDTNACVPHRGPKPGTVWQFLILRSPGPQKATSTETDPKRQSWPNTRKSRAWRGIDDNKPTSPTKYRPRNSTRRPTPNKATMGQLKQR